MIRTALLTLAALAVVGPATAQEQLTNHHQGKGYSIRFPGGWRVIDPQATASLNQSMNSAMPMTRGVGCDVIIAKGLGLEDSPTLNIVVVDDEMPINDEARQILKGIPNQVAPAMRGRAENIVVRDEKFSGQPGLVVQYDLSVMGKKLTQMMFAMPKAGKTYMICCTGPKDEFRSLEPTFRMMIASMEVSFLNSIPRWLLFGLIGGGLSLLATVLTKVLKGSPEPTPSYRI